MYVYVCSLQDTQVSVSAYKQIKLVILRTGPFKVIAKHPVTGKVGQVLLMVEGM